MTKPIRRVRVFALSTQIEFGIASEIAIEKTPSYPFRLIGVRQNIRMPGAVKVSVTGLGDELDISALDTVTFDTPYPKDIPIKIIGTYS
jgi:hypothetical protein